MRVQHKPWEKHQGLRFSRVFRASANIKSSDVLTVRAENSPMLPSRSFPHSTLRQRAAVFGGQLHLSEEVNWDAPLGNEMW